MFIQIHRFSSLNIKIYCTKCIPVKDIVYIIVLRLCIVFDSVVINISTRAVGVLFCYAATTTLGLATCNIGFP